MSFENAYFRKDVLNMTGYTMPKGFLWGGAVAAHQLEGAQELLTTSSLKVREIAGRCGYTDQHYFSYCFKKYSGESPNSMRRRLDAERTGEQA